MALIIFIIVLKKNQRITFVVYSFITQMDEWINESNNNNNNNNNNNRFIKKIHFLSRIL